MNDHYWLSVRAVAELKQVSKTAVYKAIKDNRLPASKLAGYVLVKDHDAYAWEPKAGWPKGKPRPRPTDAEAAGSEKPRKQPREEQE